MTAKQEYVRYNWSTQLELSYTQTPDGVYGVARYVVDNEAVTGITPTIVANTVEAMEYTATDLLREQLGLYLESIGV